MRNISKFIQQRFLLKVRLIGTFEYKHSQKIQDIEEIDKKLLYSAINQEPDVKIVVKEEKNKPKKIMGQAKLSKN